METRSPKGLLYVLVIVFSAMSITVPTTVFYAGKLENVSALLWTSNIAWFIVAAVCMRVLHKYLNT